MGNRTAAQFFGNLACVKYTLVAGFACFLQVRVWPTNFPVWPLRCLSALSSRLGSA